VDAVSWTRGAVKIKKTCDVCGRERVVEPGVFRVIKGRWSCNWDGGFIPYEVADAVPYKTFRARPIKDARPFDPRPSYQLAEEQIFASLRDLYAYGFLRVTNSPASAAAAVSVTLIASAPPIGPLTASPWTAAWSAIYFHGVVTENKRPAGMVADARALLKTIADWLVANQEAGPGVIAGSGRLVGDTIPNSDTQPEWGGYRADASFQTSGGFPGFFALSSAAAGLALLRAYQVFGTQLYADAARACAWFLRNLQCSDLMVTSPASSDAGGASPKHWGAWSQKVQFAAAHYAQDSLFLVNSLLCLRFLALYKTVLGDETIGSPSTATVTGPNGAGAVAWVTGSRAALVSVCMAEARAFWETAQPDAVLGTSIKGLSTATPAEGFNSYPAAKNNLPAGTGSWIWGANQSATATTITGQGWALALSSLYEVDGASSFVVAAFDWLMGFASNPATELPATTANRMVSGYDDAVLLAGTKGTFDPKTALTTTLTVRDATLAFTATPQNASSVYDLSSVGLLAPLYTARQASSFKALKDALDQPRRQSMQNGRTLWLGQLGECGLSYQVFNNGAFIFQFVARAAMVGLVYRQQPGAFLGKGHAN
jgi:hypothetical protein